ncbi:MAG: tRNA glutamyl-Q(34) synthetase GluQRS [Hyphomicrobium sp.]|nr:tRNA glutamyl-Q(34) synthetase GluQRS [Hyphomicrobium sp.]
MTAPFITRFAPSPNGELHLGHALSALTAFDMARRYGGQFILRIEDIDVQRTREQHVAGICDDLRWLGIEWDGPLLRQSVRFDAYREATQRLQDLGVLYPCFATRSEIEAAAAGRHTGTDPDGSPLYPGLCKNLSASEIAHRTASGEPYCLRLDMDLALEAANAMSKGRPLVFGEWTGEYSNPPSMVTADPARWGDAVIVRKDTPASYHLAVVVDDAMQGITHVIRGRDLYAATGLHRLLQVLLDIPEPVYHHHRLLLDAAGRKLSKSIGSTSLRSLRQAGTTPAEIRQLVGLPPAPA